MGTDERILEVLRTLIERADEQIDRSPLGHLLAGRRENLRLSLSLPLDADPEALRKAAARLDVALVEAIEAALQRRAAFQPGSVLCLRCSSTGCGHGRPTSSRQVFAGYSPSGTPEFLDLGELLLARHDPRVGELFDEGRAVVTHQMTEQELTARLLPVFKEQSGLPHPPGQVVAGCSAAGSRPDVPGSGVEFPGRLHPSPPLPRRFGLNVLGLGPDGEPPGPPPRPDAGDPGRPAVRWAHSALAGLSLRPRPDAQSILRGWPDALERGRGAHSRRTRHAERRHSEGGRPTRMALLDLARAGRTTCSTTSAADPGGAWQSGAAAMSSAVDG
ncbi:MAG: hypothetical protein Q9Q13_01420 [Acidobacteriota bacterium]|nr:hypothetical protein [Acidobacteriota bacterium]